MDLFFEDNSDKIETIAYLWTNNTPSAYQHGSSYNGVSYAIYNEIGGNAATAGPSEYDQTSTPDGILMVGQGFIVKAKPGGLNQPLVFNNSIRIKGAGEFYQRNTTDRFWLTLTNQDDIVNMILIGYNENAVDHFDLGFDAPLMYLHSDALFSRVEDQRLAINGLQAPFNRNDVIPIGTNIFSTGRYTIALHNMEGVFLEQEIYLKDKFRNIIHNLSISPYRFKEVEGLHENRFEIIFKRNYISASSTQNLLAKNEVKILKKDQSIFVESTLDKIAEIEIFDLRGQSLYSNKKIGQTQFSIPIHLFQQPIIIVNTLTEKGKKHTQKLILN